MLLLLPQIYIDAKTGVFDVGKLTELLAKQPQILNRGRGEYVERTPADEEKERHSKKMEDGLKQLIEMAKKQQTVSGELVLLPMRLSHLLIFIGGIMKRLLLEKV